VHILDLLGLNRIFPIEPTVEDAAKAFGVPATLRLAAREAV
jgi:hypothetical protein